MRNHVDSGERSAGSDDDILLLALLNTSTAAEAAKQAGVSARTVFRRLADPEFVNRWNEVKSHRLASALKELTQASGEAVDCLRRNLSCGSPSVEVRAAGTILELGMRATEVLELADRLATLEALWEVQGDGRSP